MSSNILCQLKVPNGNSNVSYTVKAAKAAKAAKNVSNIKDRIKDEVNKKVNVSSYLLSKLLLCSGDVELNPGPIPVLLPGILSARPQQAIPGNAEVANKWP